MARTRRPAPWRRRPLGDAVAFFALGTAITAGVAAWFAIATVGALARRAASTFLAHGTRGNAPRDRTR